MNSLSPHAQHIEALLFSEGGPLTIKKLSQLLSCSEDSVRAAIQELHTGLFGHSITLLSTSDDVALVTTPEVHEIVALARSRDEERDIGDAGLEVLAILLYEGPSTRATIDYIRGVNSSTTMRTLLARGLIDRKEQGREYVYAPTVELVAHLGVSSTQSLPDFETLSRELASFKATAPAT